MNQHDVVDAFKPDYARRHGCAWFVWGDQTTHNPETTGGWASLGGEPAFEFHRPQDLPKDVVWWTNLTKAEAWSLGRWSHIKHAGFLGPDWLALMSEWGVPQEIEQLRLACAGWSEVLGRIGEFLSRWSAQTATPDAPKGPRPQWAWGDGDFHEALAARLGWNIPKDTHHPALGAAYCETIEQEIPPQTLTGKRKMVMVLPRNEHAQRLLATRFPEGEFEEVSPTQWPSTPDERWSWLANQTQPLLVCLDHVQWKPGHEPMAMLWWGLRGRRFAGASLEPVWVTGEEALELQEHIDTFPSAVLRAPQWQSGCDVPYWPHHLSGFLHDNSIITGLLNEALWRAAATPVRTPTKRIKSGVSPRAVWWRAADRRLCFRAAKKFREQGFDVLSYGNGTVTLLIDPRINPPTAQQWGQVLQTTSLRLPVSLVSSVPSLPGDASLTSPHVDVWLKQTNSLETWLWLDRLLWPWMGPQKHTLKPILEHAMRSLASLPSPSDQWGKQWRVSLKDAAKEALSELMA